MQSTINFLTVTFVILTTIISTAGAWRTPPRGKQGMAASQSKLASDIGVDIMRRGGNAVDAAIAIGFALAVTYPEAGNIGGGGFMLIRLADGRTTAIDYRETAPLAAGRDVFVNDKGELIKGEGSSTVGYRASGVPGTVAGFDYALKKYGSGKLSWSELIEPARRIAEKGFPLSHRLADLFITRRQDFEPYADSRRIFLNNGDFYEEGDVLRQPELAATLARLQRDGAREFYTGRTAQLIADDMRRHNGLITLEDLKNYTVKERVPVTGSYRGHPIISMPPPSSGGTVLLECLNILEKYDVRSLGWASSRKYHVLTETMRRAFADRAEYLADPDFADVPFQSLIDKSYAAKQKATISLTRASKSVEIKAGKNVRVAGSEPTETTHYSVVDAAGNVVSNTYTINDLYGSGVTATGTGILLNDEMDDFTAQPGRPNLFGLIQGERNRIQGGKRPLSSMTPAIVLHKSGQPWFAVGARGGPRIITAVLQTVVNIVDHEMNLQQALDAPRIHHQWFPDEILHEPYGISVDTRRNLERLGHKLSDKASYIASGAGIMIDEKTNIRYGAVDSRSDGEAIGY